MSTTFKSTSNYQLGKAAFSIANCDPYEKHLSQLFPPSADPGSEGIVELRLGCSKDARHIIGLVSNLHADSILFHGCCLVSSTGQKLLLAGPPRSGKSTAAMELSVKYGWKILAEGFTVIDPIAKQLVPFAAPISLNSASVELLRQRVGELPPLVEGAWTPKKDKKVFWSPANVITEWRDYNARFDMAIFLESMPSDATTQLSVSPLTPNAFLRKLLSVSNVLKHKSAADLLVESLGSSHCLSIEGGGMEKRLDAIVDAQTNCSVRSAQSALNR